MDKTILIRELQILLEAINEQFEIIREYEDFIPQIEFDMIMENVRKLYETFHRLEHLNDPLFHAVKKSRGTFEMNPLEQAPGSAGPMNHGKPLSGKITLVHDSSPEQRADETNHMPVPETQAGEIPGTEIPAGPENFREKIMPPDNPPGIPEPPGSTEPPESSEPPEPPEPPPIAMHPVRKKESNPKQPAKMTEPDLFTPGEPAFNIRLKEAREKSLGPKINRHESFKASIGINDKFMFINELFDGNLRDYNESIETLGGFKTLPQAQEYLDLLRRRNNWNSASNAFKRIKELVEKRF